MTTLLWLTIALPLAGAAVLLLGGKATDAWGHLLGCATVIGSFLCGAALFADLLGRPAEDRLIREVLFSWVPVGDLRVDFGLQLDTLSICFVLLITGVGALIHVYSIGYMSHDPDRRRFFAYLNLFVAAMLVLVLADNYLGLYLGWEGVGLASYLLIGFWYYKPSAATAAKKAFVVNRVGDMGLAIALMVLFAVVGSVGYTVHFHPDHVGARRQLEEVASVGQVGHGPVFGVVDAEVVVGRTERHRDVAHDGQQGRHRLPFGLRCGQ